MGVARLWLVVTLEISFRIIAAHEKLSSPHTSRLRQRGTPQVLGEPLSIAGFTAFSHEASSCLPASVSHL